MVLSRSPLPRRCAEGGAASPARSATHRSTRPTKGLIVEGCRTSAVDPNRFTPTIPPTAVCARAGAYHSLPVERSEQLVQHAALLVAVPRALLRVRLRTGLGGPGARAKRGGGGRCGANAAETRVPKGQRHPRRCDAAVRRLMRSPYSTLRIQNIVRAQGSRARLCSESGGQPPG
jgi:hypothetical protein